MKNKHGGKRKGAGRPSKYGEETVLITFRVPRSLVDIVKKAVAKLLANKK